jgi:hypothetical protein
LQDTGPHLCLLIQAAVPQLAVGSIQLLAQLQIAPLQGHLLCCRRGRPFRQVGFDPLLDLCQASRLLQRASDVSQLSQHPALWQRRVSRRTHHSRHPTHRAMRTCPAWPSPQLVAAAPRQRLLLQQQLLLRFQHPLQWPVGLSAG